MSFSLSMKTLVWPCHKHLITPKPSSLLKRPRCCAGICLITRPSSMEPSKMGVGPIEEAIPSSLVQFVGMIEHGADIKSQLRFGVSKTDLVIAQLLQYNCYAKYKEGAATHRHSTKRETPFPIFLGMSVYAKTRKRMLVEMLHEHGISISYDRVLEVSAQLGDAAVSKYMKDGVVCPQVLRRGLFTTAAMDNIDHNPTSTFNHSNRRFPWHQYLSFPAPNQRRKW